MAREAGAVPGPPRAPPPPLEEAPPSDEGNDPQPDVGADDQGPQLTEVQTVKEVADIEPLLRLGLSK
eukprot:5220249-Pyramimonas_sp.AAC.1